MVLCLGRRPRHLLHGMVLVCCCWFVAIVGSDRGVKGKEGGLLNLHFVLERLLVLLTADQGLNLSGGLAVLQINPPVHLLAILVGRGTGLLHVHLSVITVGIPPLEVLVGRLLEVHLHVFERVLLDVADTQVGVLLDLARAGDGLAGQQLDESGFARTVGADDGARGRTA